MAEPVNEKLACFGGISLPSATAGQTLIATDAAGDVGSAGWPTYMGSGSPVNVVTPPGANALYVDTVSELVWFWSAKSWTVLPVSPNSVCDPVAAGAGLIAETFDSAMSVNPLTLPSNQMYASRVYCANPTTSLGAACYLDTLSGASPVAGANCMALISTTGVVLAVSQDLSTAFASAGLIQATWSAAVKLAAGVYYVGVMATSQGGTGVTTAGFAALYGPVGDPTTPLLTWSRNGLSRCVSLGTPGPTTSVNASPSVGYQFSTPGTVQGNVIWSALY